MYASVTDPTEMILDALRELAAYDGGQWYSMGAIRDTAGLNRESFIRGITSLALMGQIVTIPEENQKTITYADWYNAVTLGGEPKHYACLA